MTKRRYAVKINLCRDPALVDGWCLRVRMARRELYVWPDRWRLRALVTRPDFT